VGSNAAENHPIAFSWVMEAVASHGAKVMIKYVLDDGLDHECPVCGGEPDLAALDGEHGGRHRSAPAATPSGRIGASGVRPAEPTRRRTSPIIGPATASTGCTCARAASAV
jgi:hypothetical protein